MPCRPRRGAARAAVVFVALVVVAGVASWMATGTRSTVRLAAGTEATAAAPDARRAAGAEPTTSTARAEPPTSTARAEPTTSTARPEPPSATEPATSGDPTAPAPAHIAADPAGFAAAVGDAEWAVLALGTTPDSSPFSHIAADQAAVDRLWRRTFAMAGPAPVLPPERGALVVPVGGSCRDASRVHGIEGLVDADTDEVVAAVQFDPSCADLERGGTVIGPPRALYVIAVPLEVATHVAGVTTVVASVAEIEWEVLAIAAVHGPGPVGGAADQAQLDGIWHRYGPPGPAPRLPAGQGALVVGVPGSCDDAAQVLAVDTAVISHDDTYRSPSAVVTFDGSCAKPLAPGPADWQQGTMYVITVAPPVARSLDGARVVITGSDPTREPVDAYATHPAVVAAGIGGNLDWEVVAIGVTADPSLVGDVVTDQAGIDDRWRRHELEGAAPVLAPGRGALFVPVAGSCDQASDVRFIDAMPNGEQTEVQGVVHVDGTCAEQPDDAITDAEPRSLFVITVPLDVAEQLSSVGALPAGSTSPVDLPEARRYGG